MAPKIDHVFLEYRGDSIGLVPGENLVGRNIECRVRFNDPAVSRRHMRFVVEDQRLVVEDLNSANGTWVNETLLSDVREINHGDVVEVGSRTMRVSLVYEDFVEDEAITEERDVEDGQAEPTRDVDEQTQDRLDDWTKPSLVDEDDEDRHNRPTPQGTPQVSPPSHALDAPALQPASVAGAAPRQRVRTVPSARPRRRAPSLPSRRICPRCRSQVSFERDICGECNYRWPKGLPMTVTQPLRLRDVDGAERRRFPRMQVLIPVIYNSDLLCFDAVARDLSEGGVFLATDLLDEPGTRCSLTLLPDGAQALSVHGMIRRIVQHGVAGLPGMGVEFVDLDSELTERIMELLHLRPPSV